MKRQGFTLIELMVAIAIIGILTAIALPRFANITKEGEIAQIQANRKNLQTSLDMALVKEDIKVEDLRGYYPKNQLEEMGREESSLKVLDLFEELYISGKVPSLPKTNRDKILILENISEDYIKENMGRIKSGKYGWVITLDGFVYPLVTEDEYGIRYDKF